MANLRSHAACVRAERAEARIAALFGETDAILRQRGGYLVGGAFSPADLTLAALAAPVLEEPEMLPATRSGMVAADPLEGLPASLAAVVRRFRATATGEHCREMYRRHRRRPRISQQEG